jgi:tetratricopeptide (TPR) repeat protein
MNQTLVLFACLFIACGTASAKVDPKGHPDGKPLHDLHYGDVLFHYLEDDEYGALVRLMAVRKEGRADSHEVDARILAGGMELTLGQTNDALRLFDEYLKTETREWQRDIAWLAMARTFYQKGAYEDALSAMRRMNGVLDERHETERHMLESELLISTGQFSEAAARLKLIDVRQEWLPYAQYNLGIAMIRGGDTDGGAAFLNEVDRSELKGEEYAALRDRANVAAGIAYLQAEQWQKATDVLKRVRLNGSEANRALLGLGWAKFGTGNFNGALSPWQELTHRDPFDSAVQEALLAVPYTLAKLGAKSAAASSYDKAMKAYRQMAEKLDAMSSEIHKEKFIERLQPAESGDSNSIYQPLAYIDHIPDAPEYRAMKLLIASDQFQSGLRTCRELRHMDNELSNWSTRIADPTSAEHELMSSMTSRLQETLIKVRAAEDRQEDVLTGQLQSDLVNRKEALAEFRNEVLFGKASLSDRNIGGTKNPQGRSSEGAP